MSGKHNCHANCSSQEGSLRRILKDRPWRKLLVVLAAGMILFPSVSFAVVKDSDADGLTDQAEERVYHTDPMKADTDGDKVSDGEEVIDGTDPLNPNDSRLVSIKNKQKVVTPTDPTKFSWYSSRTKIISIGLGMVISVLVLLVLVFRIVSKIRSRNVGKMTPMK